MIREPGHLDQPVLSLARRDVVSLRDGHTVQESLDAIREHGVGERIVYFYVLDADNRLVGVLPTRRLLISPLEARLSDLMIPRVIALPHTATVLDACEAFVRHKYLAIPIVDDDRRVLGVVDASILGDEAFDFAEREQTDALFESIGFRISQVRDAGPLRAFRFRFPWLLATIGSGLICAWLTSAFELTLAKAIVLAFFLTLMLGLGESVSIQSMSITIQALRSTPPSLRWYFRSLRREIGTALLLGLACGTLVGLTAFAWRGDGITSLVIGASIVLALTSACVLGLSVPALLHAVRLDPKIAAGPLTLALTDICTLVFYFGLASSML